MSAADPHANSWLVRAGADPADARLGMVLVHGRGGSARDILGIARQLAIPDIAAVAPEAAGNCWWPVSFLAAQNALEPYLTSALAAMERAVASLVKEGIGRERIALIGFSQGACLACEYAARRGGPFHSLFILSGALVGTADAPGVPTRALYGYTPKTLDYATRLDGVPVYFGCHEADPHIPLARVGESAKVFENLGAEVETVVFPGEGHAILPSELDAIRTRLCSPG